MRMPFTPPTMPTAARPSCTWPGCNSEVCDDLAGYTHLHTWGIWMEGGEEIGRVGVRCMDGMGLAAPPPCCGAAGCTRGIVSEPSIQRGGEMLGTGGMHSAFDGPFEFPSFLCRLRFQPQPAVNPLRQARRLSTPSLPPTPDATVNSPQLIRLSTGVKATPPRQLIPLESRSHRPQSQIRAHYKSIA